MTISPHETVTVSAAEFAQLRGAAHANNEALAAQRTAGRNADVVAAAAHEFCALRRASTNPADWTAEVYQRRADTYTALFAACDATTPSPTRTHMVVAVKEWEWRQAVVDEVTRYMTAKGSAVVDAGLKLRELLAGGPR